MNKQGKGKIEWCDYTWNPVTGCLHSCPYCYAAKIYKRFKKSFEPTFHPEKLSELGKVKTPQKIFVGSTTDLFGEWVPDEWIKDVVEACKKASQHKYIFLTKNPAGYRKAMSIIFGNKFWLGTTINTQKDIERHSVNIMNTPGNLFLSVEPIHGWIDLTKIETPDGNGFWNALTGDVFVPFTMLKRNKISWVIIGAETGPGAKAPPFTWAYSIIEQCRAANVPVFLKSNLCTAIQIKGIEIIQEWPELLK